MLFKGDIDPSHGQGGPNVLEDMEFISSVVVPCHGRGDRELLTLTAWVLLVTGRGVLRKLTPGSRYVL